jgi:hypothetical protein
MNKIAVAAPYQLAEKDPARRLLKNAQTQGARNPKERGVHISTPQRRGMRATQ